jgi:CRP-like cAMP-binding protein
MTKRRIEMQALRSSVAGHRGSSGGGEILFRVPFLRGVSEPGLARIAERLATRRFAKGQTLFFEGEECTGAWVVCEGSVSLYKVSMDGRVQILETCRPGDVIALGPAIDGGPHVETAQTREESRLIFFPRADLLAAARTSPEVGLALARSFACRLRGLAGQVASVALHGVRGRLAAYLLELARESGRELPDGSVEVLLEARQEEIARRLGTVREVLARSLRALRDEGVIERRRECVRVRDLGALQLIAER